MTGKDAGHVKVPGDLLDVKPRRDVLHAVVVWQQNRRRRWTAHTKTRSEVSGGGAKPWKQKGTGRARSGSNTSPVWRGGGVALGPRKKIDLAVSLPKKVRKLGLRMALADRLQADKLRIVKGLAFDSPDSKQAAGIQSAFGGTKMLVVVGDGRTQKGVASVTERSFRNLDRVRVLQAEGLNVYDILGAEVVLIAESAVEKVFARLGASGVAA